MRLYALERGIGGETPLEISVENKKVSLFSLFVEGERRSLKTLLGRFFFYLMAKGRFWIYYVADRESGQMIHSSYVTGRSFKFPFMSQRDIHIGPCNTAPEYRGRGIYRNVLRVICRDHKDACNKVYMMVHEDNIPSIKGIEAAGFRHIGTVERTGIFKVYRRTDHG